MAYGAPAILAPITPAQVGAEKVPKNGKPIHFVDGHLGVCSQKR